MATKQNKEFYLKKYKKKFGEKFDYSKFEYVNANTQTLVKCPTHGWFYITPYKHSISKCGCRKCSAEIRWERDGVSVEQFIKRAKIVHGDTYDYSSVKLTMGMEGKINIICKRHGKFSQRASNHLNGDGCPKCRNLKTTEQFIQCCKKIHGDAYDYSNVIYIHSRKPVKIVCKKHGEFYQKAGVHLQGRGCPLCRNSRGEAKIRNVLIDFHQEFVQNKEFDDCINPDTNRHLRYDFFLPKKNILIEFDGKQHHEYIKNWIQSKEKFDKAKIRDSLKTRYAKDAGIMLIRIPYTQYKYIEEILWEILFA